MSGLLYLPLYMKELVLTDHLKHGGLPYDGTKNST
jgi:hypothetical protein